MQTANTLTLSKDNRICHDGKYTGYFLRRGGYVGTVGDRLDQFYIHHEDDDLWDRRQGYQTRAEALDALRYSLFGERA